MGKLSWAVSVGQGMGTNSKPPVWLLLMVGFGLQHGNQLTSFNGLYHFSNLQRVTVAKCSAVREAPPKKSALVGDIVRISPDPLAEGLP